jgi:alpha-tubulin suppressor-like RCC1 family protein
MFSRKKLIVSISLIILITNLTLAGWKEDAEAVKISGGENHTLILTTNKWPWGCGDNSDYQLGTGDQDNRWLPVRVLKGDMASPSDYLEDINDIAAGWKHSLALDVNRFVWAWGKENFCGKMNSYIV